MESPHKKGKELDHVPLHCSFPYIFQDFDKSVFMCGPRRAPTPPRTRVRNHTRAGRCGCNMPHVLVISQLQDVAYVQTSGCSVRTVSGMARGLVLGLGS